MILLEAEEHVVFVAELLIDLESENPLGSKGSGCGFVPLGTGLAGGIKASQCESTAGGAIGDRLCSARAGSILIQTKQLLIAGEFVRLLGRDVRQYGTGKCGSGNGHRVDVGQDEA